jgi:hypothetical protein
MLDVRFPGDPTTDYTLPLGYDIRRGKVVLRKEWREPLTCVFMEAKNGRRLGEIVAEVKPKLPRRVTFDEETVKLILEDPIYAGEADLEAEQLVSPEVRKEALDTVFGKLR